jgi:peptidoglycan/xylan/chitin deacetylase (PgdA/CDA1 family)
MPNRFAYSPINDRPRIEWPNGARVAFWVIPNIETLSFEQPWPPDERHGPVPDVLAFTTRDYGNRVGVWRMMEVLDRYNLRATVALNSDICRFQPEIIRAGVERRWEWMGHGRTNAERLGGLEEPAERALIGEVESTIAKAAGAPPRGWLGPGLAETLNTPDLLAEAGIQYVSDWTFDDQPVPLRVRSGRMITMPYGPINDNPAFLRMGWTGEQFHDAIRDEFDHLYEAGERSGQVMGLSLHPFLIGHGHRLRWLDRALKHIVSHERVWLTTGGEIADHYYAHCYDTMLTHAPFPES